jgi:hypothetical protein
MGPLEWEFWEFCIAPDYISKVHTVTTIAIPKVSPAIIMVTRMTTFFKSISLKQKAKSSLTIPIFFPPSSEAHELVTFRPQRFYHISPPRVDR